MLASIDLTSSKSSLPYVDAHVPRRTRRSASTIGGAAPDTIIGRAAADRAGARPRAICRRTFKERARVVWQGTRHQTTVGAQLSEYGPMHNSNFRWPRRPADRSLDAENVNRAFRV